MFGPQLTSTEMLARRHVGRVDERLDLLEGERERRDEPDDAGDDEKHGQADRAAGRMGTTAGLRVVDFGLVVVDLGRVVSHHCGIVAQ